MLLWVLRLTGRKGELESLVDRAIDHCERLQACLPALGSPGA